VNATDPAAEGSGWRRHGRSVTLIVLAALFLGGAVALVLGLSHKTNPAAAPLPTSVAGSPAASSSTGGSAGGPLTAPLPPASGGSSSGKSTSGGGSGGPGQGSGVGPAPTRQSGLSANSVRIPQLAVTASVVTTKPVHGVLTPPVIPNVVGEWNGSAPLDATTGETTLAGHVNWAGMGPFAFGKIAYLHPGDLIYTTDSTGKISNWRVSTVTARVKIQPIDTAAFAGARGPRTLVLITCGGQFNATDKSYDDNVYVYAKPA